jgi:hypothetical protein
MSSVRVVAALLFTIGGVIALIDVVPAEAAHGATPPIVTKSPANREAKVGHLVKFGARAKGFPKPNVTWQVSTDGSAFVDIRGATSGILRFKATAADSGNRYQAVFSNPAGMAATAPVTLTVPSNPLALGFAVFDPTYPTTGNLFQSYRYVVGRLPNFLEWYQTWPTSAANSSSAPLYWDSQEQLARSHRLTALISWGTDNIPLDTIINGASDGEDAVALAPAAALAKSYPGTLYIRLDWEMNGSWSGWNPSNPAQEGQSETPATFVAMWQHVVNYFRAVGVTNVKWVWAPNVDGGTGTMGAYYPGNSYVDYVGLDGYNYAYTQDAAWQTPQQVFGASYSELESITQKQVIITETSSVEADSTDASEGFSKAQWIAQLSSYLPSLGNVIGVCWFNQPALVGATTVNFGVHSSSAALNAWKQYFVHNPEYHGKLP